MYSCDPAGGGGGDDIPLNPAVGMGERIVGIANGYVGSIDYNLLSKKGDFLPGNTKCNKFVSNENESESKQEDFLSANILKIHC